MKTFGDISSLHPRLAGLRESSIELPGTARDVLRRLRESSRSQSQLEVDKLAAELLLEYRHSLAHDLQGLDE